MKKAEIKRTKENIEVIKAMGSKDKAVAAKALYDFISPVIANVIDQAPVISSLFGNEEKEFDQFVSQFKGDDLYDRL